MGGTRHAAVCGVFYPARPDALRSEVDRLLAGARHAPQTDAVPKAIVVPHAGYVYSGPIAASAYRTLKNATQTISRVVLMGPAHRVSVRGLAVSSAHAFVTPLGPVPVDVDAVNRALQFPYVHILDQAHELEHSLEVQLPFLQVLFQDFSVVPIVAGRAAATEVGAVIDALWGGPETLIVISSDLSHYHDYKTAQMMDRATSRAIETLDPTGLEVDDACGYVPIVGMLDAARRHHLSAYTLDLRNSGDTAGTKDQVVGYGAYAFH